mmetsp:Transcript_3736/g.4668  ORF Transcript_3736/g.4668 Transcript_3736/m.4668 type:complete len:83 (-) Transcript_3736:1004-1252(-)
MYICTKAETIDHKGRTFELPEQKKPLATNQDKMNNFMSYFEMQETKQHNCSRNCIARKTTMRNQRADRMPNVGTRANSISFK